jgi:membrane peptidoglycan carboxypeptidase
LELILADRDPYQIGGYKVTTTLDWKAQNLAEKLIYGGAVVPNLAGSKYFDAIRKNKLGRESSWISRLRGLNLRNGAMVAQDYRTGDILAYVGSAGYYRKKTPKMNPQYDHAGQGRRQPGSAWKPIVYATGIDTGALTAGTVLLDITTPFGAGWAPKDADSLDRGPILVRDALQQSLNIPAIRALHKTGIKTVRKYSVKAGLTFLPDFGNKALDAAGLAGAIGTVEVRPVDLTAVFGAFGNDGKVTQPRHILKVEGPRGEVIYEAGKPTTKQVWKPSTAYIVADILKGNTNPAENAVWADVFALYNTRDGSRREAAVKTGTTNQLKDYSTYGFLPKPKNKNATALAVGVWYGNSDSTSPNTSRLIYSMDNAGRTWHAFVRDYMKGKPAPKFKRPSSGVVAATIDKYTGGAPGAWTRGTRTELFVKGTQPGGKRQVDPPGLIYSRGCGFTAVQPARAENAGAPASWLSAVNAWASRGGRGGSQWKSVGAYNGAAGPVSPGTGCSAPRSTTPTKDAPDRKPGAGNRGGGNDGPGPAPTCQPGRTDKPTGCVIPSN